MHQEESFGAVAIKCQKGAPAVLVECRVQDYVSLPREHAKDGETEEETAARGILEKTNLVVYIDNVFRHEVSYQTKSGIYKTDVFFAAVVDNASVLKPQKEQDTEFKWMSFDEAIETVTFDSIKEVLHHAASYVMWRYYREARSGVSAFPKLLYREHAVDIRSHMLPEEDGIIPTYDDEAWDLEETQDLALLDRREGMDVIFATPHYSEERGYTPDREFLMRQNMELQDVISGGRGDYAYPQVLLGSELYCSDYLLKRKI